MPRYRINYFRKEYCSCEIEAQNPSQVKYLYENDMLDLDNEHHGSSELGEIRSIEPVT